MSLNENQSQQSHFPSEMLHQMVSVAPLSVLFAEALQEKSSVHGISLSDNHYMALN